MHRLILVLIAFALIGGTPLHLARSATVSAPSPMAGMPCDMAAMPAMLDTVSDQPTAPCKGLTPDCLKQIGCIVDVAVPVRLATLGLHAPSATVNYWQAGATLCGTHRTPDPIPPRTT